MQVPGGGSKRVASPYSRETIDAKLDAIRADVRAVDSKLSGQIAALDSTLSGQNMALDLRLSGQIVALDLKLSGRIDNLRTEMRVWLVVVGLIVSPVLASVGSRVATAVFPLPAPQAAHGAATR
jgi:hypothetical protein